MSRKLRVGVLICIPNWATKPRNCIKLCPSVGVVISCDINELITSPRCNLQCKCWCKFGYKLTLRRELNAKEREQAAIERQARKKEESRDQSNCAQAIHYLNTLKKQCPVFYDGAGLLRAQCPGYVIFYEGDRTYVEENEREQLIEHYGEVVTECRELDRY